jgi:hypothetical protein
VAIAYDCVLIDTQGAIGPLQDAAVMAADMLVSPITPGDPVGARVQGRHDGAARHGWSRAARWAPRWRR